ncbi:MAG TPA: head-tail adaptor protein [Rhizorhapis sp.]
MGHPSLTSARRNKRVVIERPVPDNSFDGAGSGTWESVCNPWVNYQDMLPSRGEKLADGINVASRPARVRMRFRTDVTPDMRFVIDGRVMQIIAGPAELGHREGLEFMVEEYSPAGNPA